MKHDITPTSPLWQDALSVFVGFWIMVWQVICGMGMVVAGLIAAVISGGCLTMVIAVLVVIIMILFS